MKLHLPSTLRQAVLACMTAMVSVVTTCATGTLMAGAWLMHQAQAEDTFWNAANDNEHNGASTTVNAGDRLIINKFQGDPPAPQGPETTGDNQNWGTSFKVGTLIVNPGSATERDEDGNLYPGGQLWLNMHSSVSSGGEGNMKKIEGSITLKGVDPEFPDWPRNPAEFDAARYLQMSTLVFYHGSYNFANSVNIDGHVTMYSNEGGSQTFTNLASVHDDNSDVLDICVNKSGQRRVHYTLNYDANQNKDDSLIAFNGTIILHSPIDDGNQTNDPPEQVNLVITDQRVVGEGVTYQLDGSQTALYLMATDMNIPNVVSSSGVVRSKTSGVQVRQTIDMLEGSVDLRHDGGTMVWTINGLAGYGIVGFDDRHQSYKPNIIYLNTDNSTQEDALGNVIREGFTGSFTVSNFDYTANEQYGVFNTYVEVGHPYALKEATLNLYGDRKVYTYVSETGTLSSDDDYAYESFAMLAINSTDVYVGSLYGSSVSLVLSGRAPITGSAEAPSTGITPVSTAGTVTLHVGGAVDSYDYEELFLGTILKNVNIDKEGLGTQVIYNLEDDPARYITVSSGVLELGSIGDFRRLNVKAGARAELGLSVSSEVNTWGRQGNFIYFNAYDNGVDLDDKTKIDGNVVFTDKLYYREYLEDWNKETIVVTHLDTTRYAGDSVTLVTTDLAVFNPATGYAANLNKLKKISLSKMAGLVSASPNHHGMMSDPNITVTADIDVIDTGAFMAYGSLAPDAFGVPQFDAYNTTYTGTIRAVPDADGLVAASLYKDGFGTVTLAGDMSDYNEYMGINDGTLILSGSHGQVKNFSTITMYLRGKAVLDVTDKAVVSTERLSANTYRMDARSHCIAEVNVGEGSVLSITGANRTNLNDNFDVDPDPRDSYASATFLLSQGTHTTVNINGTLNMTRASFISVSPLETRYSGPGKKEINVNDGGVFNAYGIWLQSFDASEAIVSTINIKKGGVLNIGAEGIGHCDVNGKGELKPATNNHLLLNFEDGATLGILNDTMEWTTQRSIVLDGSLNVNTQGFVTESGSTAGGNAKVITLQSVMGENSAIVKKGVGTLQLGGSSYVHSLAVEEGYVAVKTIGTNYAITLGKVRTSATGSLLFDLTNKADVNGMPGSGQAHVVLTEGLEGDDYLNVTVRGGEEGGSYVILQNLIPAADRVNVIALVDDGLAAKYTIDADKGYGYVTLDSDGVKEWGTDKVITWVSAGESNFWANSTEANWKDDTTDARRFTNGSAVVFSDPGEKVTILDTVILAEKTDATTGSVTQNAMTMSTSGYDFNGTGSIDATGALVIEDGVSTTFSTSGNVRFSKGVQLGNGSTIRLEYLDDTSSNWDARISGNGTLEIATGGIHTQVLDQVMGDSVLTVALDNKTTLALDGTNAGEEAKLAAASNVVVKDGSRLLLAMGGGYNNNTVLEAGDKLYLSGDGVLTDEDDTAAALALMPKRTYADDGTLADEEDTEVTVLADTVLNDDTTIYLGGALTLGGGFDSQGHQLTIDGLSKGNITLTQVDSAADPGHILVKGTSLTLAFADGSVFANDITLENHSRLHIDNNSYYDLPCTYTLTGHLNFTGTTAWIYNYDSAVIEGTVASAEDTTVWVGNTGSSPNARIELMSANPDFDGTWNVTTTTLKLSHRDAAMNATITSSLGDGILMLGSDDTLYNVDGIAGQLEVKAEGDGLRTLRITGNGVYNTSATLAENVSLEMDARGSQTFTGANSFAPGYRGNLTVKRGMLHFYIPPTTYNTIELTSDEALLSCGYYDYVNSNGDYLAMDLGVSSGQSLIVSETGAALNGNLAPHAGGQITLGTLSKAWAAEGGLNMYGQALKLDTQDKAKLTINLSAFLSEGDYVDLFTHVGALNIDGQVKDWRQELGYLDDYFVCDDINLARTKLELTAAGTLRIKLINNSDGLYYEYQGGTNGVWDYATQAWATKDDKEARTTYSGGAAYFTNSNATVTLGEDIESREMAVKNGQYVFDMVDGHDLTINSRYYEMEGGKATFQLHHEELTDENGNPISDGAELWVESGMGDIDATQVVGDGDTANRFVLGGKTAMSGDARIYDVDLFLDGENSRLDFGDTGASELQALNGEGMIAADGATVTISNKKDGVFAGSLVASGTDTQPGANTLIIGTNEADANKSQYFADVTTDSSWNVVNNTVWEFKPTENSTLNSLKLGAQSDTTLTVNTDAAQLLGLTALEVEDGAKVTLNSTGNAPIMSDPSTPGYSHKVLGSFEDGMLSLPDDFEITRGTGTAFLMVDKDAPITLKMVQNDSGNYDLVMVAKVDDSNQFAPFVQEETNAKAGADMLWTTETMTHVNAQPNGDLARAFNAMAGMVTSSNPDGERIREALSAVAGSSTAVLGSAFSADVERQLKAIRNRTTTMGVSQCEVNENMPYYNAWINAEGNHRELDSDGLAAGYTHDSWGGTVGFDVDVTPSLTMGLAVTAMYGDIEAEGADRAEGDFDTMYLSAFARYAKNAWVHTFVATVGRADVTLERTVNVGNTSYTAQGETDGTAFGFLYEVGRVFAVSEDGSTCWQPVFNVALRNSSISGYDEEGSDAGLSVGDQDFTTITFGVGARMQTVMGENLYNRSSIFEARALLKFDAGDTEAEVDNALLNGDGVAHTVEGAEVGSVGVEIGAGVTIPVGAEGGSIFADASADLRSGYTNINGTVGYRVNF